MQPEMVSKKVQQRTTNRLTFVSWGVGHYFFVGVIQKEYLGKALLKDSKL
jgi:hypothetical protein